jgi:transcriptional regulator with XRE-family HTH domain
MTSPDLWEMRRALGRELARLRNQAGLSQRKFAPLTGYSRATISDAELGRYHLPRDFWVRAEMALHAGQVLSGSYDEIENRPPKAPAGTTCPVCRTSLRVLLVKEPE